MRKSRKWLAVVLSAVVALGAVGCTTNNPDVPPVGGDDSYTNPNTVFAKYDNKLYNEYLMGEETKIANQWPGYGIGDPFIMRHNGMYYLYCSSLDSEVGVRAYKSADLVSWTPITGEGLREGYVSEDPETRAAYAPEVYYWNGTFYMYMSPAGNGHYVFTSTSPEGPFTKVTDNIGLSIDGSVFIDDDESMWFTYADHGGIRMTKMDNMIPGGGATPQLNNTTIGGWTEGSYILKRDGIYYLTYTGNHVASDGYRIAYSTADHVATAAGGVDRNAWTRADDNPLVLETETELKGIGHSSTVMGPDMDSYYLAYHMLNSSGGPNRSLGIDRLLFNGKQMTVHATLTDSVKPTLPVFYANGIDSEKFDEVGDYKLSKASTTSDFTAEYNFSGSAKVELVSGYVDENNYVSVEVDLEQKKITLSKVENGQKTEVASGTLVNDFRSDVLHTIRVSNRDNKVDVVFDNMTKIDDAELDIPAGKIGYKGAQTVGYTAFSDVAMGLSDQKEAKQAEAMIGASQYLFENKYNEGTKLGTGSVVTVIEDGSLEGVKQLTLANKGDYASYLTNFKQEGRYALEMVYPAADGGKKIGVKLNDGKVICYTLPTVDTEEDYVKAIVGELVAPAGISTMRIENVGNAAVSFVSFRCFEASDVTPLYEQSLSDYAAKGADYKTIWKIKDGGHWAKAGTRQLVYFGDNTITDFTLEVEMKLDGSTGTSTAGIVFHAQNYAASSHDSYTSIQGYYLAINDNGIVLEKLNYADGSDRTFDVAQSNPFSDTDDYVKIKIQMRGNKITVFANDVKVIEKTDAKAFTSGKVGLYTNGAAVIYKNIKVSA